MYYRYEIVQSIITLSVRFNLSVLKELIKIEFE